MSARRFVGAALFAFLLVGCGGAGGSRPASSSSGRQGLPQASFKLTVRGEFAYNPDPAHLTTVMLPLGGVVTSSVGGIRCGIASASASQVCEATLPYGTTGVTLTATPDAAGGYGFSMFAGSCSGPGGCSVDVTSDRFVVVRFAKTQAGLGAHPNFSDPAVHGPAYTSFAQGTPGALACTACHGASLEGQGLAPSCNGCHASPTAPLSGGDPCASGNGGCAPGETCVNDAGAVTCVCVPSCSGGCGGSDGCGGTCAVGCAPIPGGPYVLYTDLVSGPNGGGENDAGAYLSIFGKNFGAGPLGSSTRVYIGGAEVARYLSLGTSRGRPDIQQITVQVGALGNPTPGTPLPIDVVVDGVHSNPDHTFIVNPGEILFVDNVAGNDGTAVAGDPTRPFRHVQTSDLSAGAWGRAGPGDIIVMRGTGSAWTDVGLEGYFMRFRDKSGSAPTGAPGTGPIVVMGYPGEDAFIRGTLAGGMDGGCISAVNGQSFPGMGQWAVIANLRIDCEGYDGPVSQEIYGDHWRVVNNDLAASTAPTSGPSVPRMGGITGNGQGSVWLGNHIHDIQGSPDECHGIYIDGDGTYEIAFNNIHAIRSGNGFQVYVSGSSGSDSASNVVLHHNWIHDVDKHGINVADNSAAGFKIYDNVVFDTQRAGIRFNSTLLRGAQIFGNTFYNTNAGGNSAYGALTNDANLPADALDVEDNIFWPHPGTDYLAGGVGFDSPAGTVTHNLWYGGTGTPSADTAPILANPGFVTPGSDFHLVAGGGAVGVGLGSPAATALLATDYDLYPRNDGGAPLDVGAYAFR